MSGNRWILLAVFSLILIAPPLTAAQHIPADNFDIPAPVQASHADDGFVQPIRLPEPPVLPPRLPVSPGTITSPQMMKAAGIIFSGRVTSVGHAAPTGEGTGSTVVTFQVEHAVRGTSSGQSLTIREWSGLWARGERYRVGENVLLFLYPPSKLGLTSPVGGALGRFPIDPRGRVLLSPQHQAIFVEDPVIARRAVVPLLDFVKTLEHVAVEK
jgi:hypothetical protein